MNGRVLAVAGSDSGGGAGIEADIKTVTSLGGYAATAITALTVQNTLGIARVFPIPADFVAQAMAAVLSDLGADAVKTGMLVDAATVTAIADTLDRLAPDVPLIVDPVLVSSSGTRLLREDAIDVLKQRLMARAAVVTPNMLEAELLAGRPVDDLDSMKAAAVVLRAQGPRAVVVTGGHLAGARVCDVTADADGVTVLEGPRLDTQSTHGTGCTFASAIATGIAQGMPIRAAVARAHRFVHEAIRTAPGLGRGHGPLNHAVSVS